MPSEAAITWRSRGIIASGKNQWDNYLVFAGDCIETKLLSRKWGNVLEMTSY